ncbi:MFS transporter [Streptosporangium sp. NBC_01755]|uniref:MDR family MFS transporter n=1 Tax=unclassified Streptosporangium TaxID=2632669 RepID=UPI002DD9A318|nr:MULTISPECIES: MDR family MFS transporter [unclassified Streptosporangium]WSA27263.1 MFS transporter [Streptosporangium sp. NBC_01810]WSD01184.1 MFS transporter [Streptosporangium sp. NBC_01755]
MEKDSAKGADSPPAAEKEAGLGFSHRQILVTMSGLVIAMLLAMLDNMIVAPALPTIVGELGGLNHLAWVATGYVLASTVSTPIWGKLGDLYGRRITFVAAVAIFLIGSMLCGVSQDMAQLIGFRAVQGLGAGGLMVGVLSIIGEMIPPRDRSKYQGVMMAVMPVAMIGGPLIGGFITDNLSWRWAFYVNVPLGVVTLALCWITLAKLPKGSGKAVIDWWGTALLTVWITALVLITSWGGTQYDWGSAQILGLAALAIVAFIAFVFVQRRVAEPIMPLRVFKSLNFTLSGVVAFISGFAMFGAISFLPQFQQFVQGSSATNSGLALMPMMIAAMVVSLSGGVLISKTGHYKSLPIIGAILVTAGLALFATMDLGTSTFTSGIYMVLLGAGMGAMMQTSTLIAQNSLDLRDMGAGTGVSTFLRNMGSSLGVSLLGAVYASQLTDSLTGGGTATQGVAASATSMTPQALRALPEAARHLFQQAVTDGVTVLFTWGAAVAAIGIVVALFIRQVPLRGAAKPVAVGS